MNSAGSSSDGRRDDLLPPRSQEDRRVGEHILSELRTVVPGNQNNVLSANYYILRNAPMTAVLVETASFQTRQIVRSSKPMRADAASQTGRERVGCGVQSGSFDQPSSFQATAPRKARSMGDGQSTTTRV